MRRVRHPPETVQSSALDCGPAALSSLLRGLGAPGSYGPLRDLCATDVDGTSIDSIEAVARAAGTDAEQLVVPAEHVLALPEEYLPAIVVTVLPDGFTHFVVLWRLGRAHAIVMDPAVGLRRVPRSQLSAELYRHAAPVPAAAWREWAGSEVFITALRRRMASLGLPQAQAEKLVGTATSDPGIEGLAGLDGAIRAVEDGSTRRREIDLTEPIDERYRSCTPSPGPTDQVILRGAVLLRARHWVQANGDPELLNRIAAPDPGPWRALVDRVPRWGPMALLVALGGLALAATTLAEQVVARRLIDGRSRDAIAAILLVGLAGLVAAVGASWAATASGRRVERALRVAWWDAAMTLPVSFVRSRPASDLADRGHLLHRLRELPRHLLQAVFAIALVVGALVAILAAAPSTAVPVAALAFGAIAVPFAATKRASDVDHRVRTLSGSLSRFVVDAIGGAQVTGTGAMAASLRREHETGLAAWRRASQHQVSLTAAVQGSTAIVTAVGAGWAVAAASRSSAGAVLFVAAAALLVVDAGTLLAEQVRLAPTVRSVAARAAGPLQSAADADTHSAGRATEQDRGEATPGAPAPRVRLEKVRTTVGSVTILDGVDLDIEPGEHVAVVGRSGSGKSTLLDVVLGIIEPDEGRIVGIPSTGDRSVAWSAGTTRLWNDSLDANLGGTTDAPARAVPQRLAAFDAADLGQILHRRGDVRLGDAGGRLSDGEAQRIRLARAAGRPDAGLVVLDEAFRGLERDRRRVLLRRARALWHGATLLCATHDVHDTLDFDRVVVLDAGAVVEVGRPGDLAAEPGSAFALLLACDDPPPNGWRRVELASPPPPALTSQRKTASSPPGPAERPKQRPPTDATGRRGALTAWAVAGLGLTLASVAIVVVAFRGLGRAALGGGMAGAATGFGITLAGAGVAGSAAAWCSGQLAIAVGERCRRRTVEHALGVDPDAARGLGIGPVLGWAIDTDLISTALLGAASATVFGCAELAAVAVVAESTKFATFIRIVVVLAIGVLVILGIASARARSRWTVVRTDLTGRLVERIAGVETTRLQGDSRQARGEGRRLTTAADEAGRRMDRRSVAANAVPATTTVVLLVLGATVRNDVAGSAVLVGLALLTGLALQRLTFALAELVAARDARIGLRSLAAMGARAPEGAADRGSDAGGFDPKDPGRPLLAVDQVTMHHGNGGGLATPVDLTIRPGSRLLITGPSGCGKTTLGQVLSGDRRPTSGSVWRRPGARVVRVPQGADGHLFQASLAFNVLAPVSWPPANEDLDRAESILAELGLDDLLARMPGGLSQSVGDGGWRLSSGERSRICLARALLQQPDVLILDETTAPLDGEARTQILAAATRHSAATVLIAHP